VEGEREAYCWCWLTRIGVTTAAATTAAAAMKKIQILFQFAMLGRRVCSRKEEFVVQRENSIQLLRSPYPLYRDRKGMKHAHGDKLLPEDSRSFSRTSIETTHLESGSSITLCHS